MVEGNKKTYSPFIDQWELSLKTKLKGTKGWGKSNNSQDGIKLLKLIRIVFCGVEEYLQGIWAMIKSDKRLYTFS